MLYAEPLSGDPQDGWAGLVLIMPWIRNTLYELSRFSNAAPFFINRTRAVHHFSAGQASREGPQSLSDEARLSGATKLASLEKAILDGGSGVVQLRPIFNGDRLPWPLPWDGPTSLAYAPLREQGWHLGLLVSSRELGDAPHGLPLPFLLVAILGPLFIVLLTWMVTSRTLRPLRALTAAIDRLGEGDLDTPFPRSPFPDEVGGMLDAFERVRVTLRGSFRNLVDSAAAQQRLSNELAIARKIQKSMLPRAFPETPGARLRASIDMAREVCGDLYECFADPARLCFVMGDVCGKGVPAAPSRSGFRRRGRPPAVDRGTRARRPGGATVFDVHAGTRAGTVRAAVHGRRGRSHRPARHRGRRTLRRRASCRVLLNGKAVALSEEEFPLQPVRNAALRFMTVGEDQAKKNLPVGLSPFDAEGALTAFLDNPAAEFCSAVSLSPNGKRLAMDSGTVLIRSWNFYTYPEMTPLPNGSASYLSGDDAVDLIWTDNDNVLFTAPTETARQCEYAPCEAHSVVRHTLSTGKSATLWRRPICATARCVPSPTAR